LWLNGSVISEKEREKREREREFYLPSQKKNKIATLSIIIQQWQAVRKGKCSSMLAAIGTISNNNKQK